MNNTEDDTPTDELIQSHLDWTSKQGLILTANGRANEFYSEARGFPCSEEELPHYHLLEGATRRVFHHPPQNHPLSVPGLAIILSADGTTLVIETRPSLTFKPIPSLSICASPRVATRF